MQNQTMGDWPDEPEMDENEPELSDKEYLKDLAERLLHVPVMYGIDGYDIGRLSDMSSALPEPECKHDWQDGFNYLGPTLLCKKCGKFEQD